MKQTQSSLIARFFATAAIASAAGLFTACTTVGSGTGMLEPGDAPVTFSWTSKDAGNSGIMTAMIGQVGQPSAVGSEFTGPFLQVTSTIRTDAFEPMWGGWRRGWYDWGYWGRFPETAFSTQYSGKVIANLQGPGTQHLRCRFHLNTPSSGMGGGGQGECQFTGGKTVEAVFPRL